MMRRLIHVLLILALAAPMPSFAAVPRQTTTAEAVVQRVALVIGNGSYQHLDRLANPANDARAVAASLWNLGFEVIEVIDADLGQTLAAMTTFARRLRPGMEALFYYAGHAVQWNGANFLLPTSARVGSNADLLHQAIDAGAIVQVMEKAGARLNLLILDSCRDNPFPDGIAEGSSGLAEMRGQTAEMLIGYATAPGTVASDGEGRHSPYTAALLEHLEEPGLEVANLFRRVRSSVRLATDGNQIPWLSSSLENEFYFRPAAQPAIQLAALGSSPTDTLGMLPPSVVVELAYWQSIKDSRDPGALGTFLERHPDGNFADLARRKLAQLSGREPAAALLPPPDAPDEARSPDPTLREVESFVGVGPIALPLDLPAGTDPGRLRVRLDQLPGNGVLTLGGNETLVSGDRLTASMLGELVFQPHIGSRSAQDRLRYTVLDGASEIAHGDLVIAASLHPCDVLGGHPHDPNRVSNGVRIELVDTVAAIAACQRAVEQFPDVPRFAEELGRSYRAAGDYAKAMTWHRRAAATGYSAAQVSIGKMYYDGLGVPVDDALALRWYRMAAEQDDSWAYVSLGIMAREGRGVPQDHAEALRWFMRAAEAGNDWAFTNIGRMYAGGLGISQDFDRAVAWFRRAADMGDLLAQITLGRMYRDGEGVAQDYRQSVRWYRAAAGQGFAHAEARLGKLYEEGLGVAQDYGEALKWYQRAAAQGEVWSHRYLGRLYETGEGVPQDAREAVRWYRIAAEQGNPWAQRDMGRMYEAGKGVARDPGEAALWYARAAGQDDAKARALALERLSGLAEDARASAAERMLVAAGYLQGQADGRLDPAARAAIATFQRAAGLPVDGAVSIDLLVALGRALAAGEGSGAGREL
ncbi:MAG: peptidase caspase catalytic subunit p20 [Geminicoccaceae bacterium]|nr:peptidase caspase catalytic subunit p20 [Geminicoccaceae bacterium]